MEKMERRFRIEGSNFFLLLMLIGVGTIMAAAEYRLRNYVNYPWLEERKAVMDSLDRIEKRVERVEERAVKIETTLEALQRELKVTH